MDSALETMSEIRPLTREAAISLLTGRDIQDRRASANGRRRGARWPFPGTVELWIANATGGEDYLLATCLNLGMEGIGILCDESLPIGQRLKLAIHQPEASLHGRGCVRHCTHTDGGHYIGLQLLFEEEESGGKERRAPRGHPG